MLSGLREEAAWGLTEYAMLYVVVAQLLVLLFVVFPDRIRDIYEWLIEHAILNLPFPFLHSLVVRWRADRGTRDERTTTAPSE